jgi:uncharacterized protein YdaU (DUF1376 family)
MHYYQFNIGDYQSHTSHLSDMEDLAYRRLLDWYYLHELTIPLEVTEIARQIRMRSHSDCISIVLQEYFERTTDGWIHHRANKEMAKTGEKSVKASASAKARWKKRDANALQTQSDSNAIKERKGNENKENKIESTCLTFDEFWNMYGKKVDSKKCKDKFETIKESDRKKILATLELYVKSKPEVKFRKDPIRYLTGEIWNDEIIESKPIFADPKIESFYNSSLAMIKRGERTHKEHNEVVKQNKYHPQYLLTE